MATSSLLVIALLLWLASRRMPRRRRFAVRGIGLIVALVVNPLSAWVVWEPVNKHLLGAMSVEAHEVELRGKTFREVRALFGAPTTSHDDGEVTTWNYRRPFFYLFGSKFQVHFRRGVVYYYEPFDD
jgi:hypothetical protein